MKFKFSFKIFLLTVVYGLTFELSVAAVYAVFTSRSINVGNNITTGFWITPSPTITVTPTPTLTPTPSPTLTITPTPTVTLTPTVTETPTPSLTVTPTETPTLTPTITVTSTPTPTLTPTITPTLTPTVTETPTPTITPTPTVTLTPTVTQPAPQGLIAYWKMEEGSGNSVVDSSENNHTLNLGSDSSAPSWDLSNSPPTSKSGNKSLLFDGINDIASSPTSLDFRFTSGYTIEAWVKANSAQFTPDQGVISKWFGGNGYMIWMQNGQVYNYINGSGTSPTGVDLRDGLWHHIAVVWNVSGRAVYIDGVEKVNEAYSGSAPESSSSDLILGNYLVPNDPRNFHGNIDEVMIYNYARSSSEILADSGIVGSVVINEFMPDPSDNQDWIELYNPSGGPINISGWKLSDVAGVFETLNATISSGSYLVVNQFQRLDNSGDTIFLRNNNQILTDSRSYLGSEVFLNKSIGRNPDGTGDWKPCTTSSQGSSNNIGC